MKNLVLALCLGAAAALAQVPHLTEPPAPTELKAALSLTDAQVAQFQQIQKDRFDAQRQALEQAAEKDRSLRDMVASGSADALAMGRMLQDAQALRQQAADINKRYQQQALALLTPDQQAKLKPLADAARLRPAIEQAVAFGLLEGATRPHALGRQAPASGPVRRAPAPATALRHAPSR